MVQQLLTDACVASEVNLLINCVQVGVLVAILKWVRGSGGGDEEK